ncbi:MAG TPA: hypothetical protein VMP89_06190 [Solirubrobacteraceae bacterium]|nr:hypothetical protein [Solirubrobacteraceae bacterium]
MFEFETTATRTVCFPELDAPADDEELLLPHAATTPAAAITPSVPTRIRAGLRRWKPRNCRPDSWLADEPCLRLI